MSPRRILWFALVAIAIFFFYSFISVETFAQHVLIYSTLGGVALFITLFQALGDFKSLYELTEKVDPADEVVPGRNLSPFAALPALAFIFILIFHHGTRKKDELTLNGVLTKGTVIGGQSTRSTRRMRTTTSYNINVSYLDSSNRPHTIDESVNGSEFGDVYQGAQVDVIYSKKYPSLAKVVFDVKELSKFIKIPNEKLSINHLTNILDGNIPEDSLLSYLNSINYEWTKRKEGLYTNDKLDFVIKVFPGNKELAFIERSNLYTVRGEDELLEDGFSKNGFKKKAKNVDGKSVELYYNDKYTISKENKVPENNNNSDFLSAKIYTVYHILKTELVKD